jgi:hypothetical protein
MLTWFYEIRGAEYRLVRKDGAFKTEWEAIAAGTRYLQTNKATVGRPDYQQEIFSVTAGQTLVGRIQ